MKTIWIINQFAGTLRSGWGERHYYLTKPLVDAGKARVVIISSANNHMFNHPAETTGLFTQENFNGVEFCWIRIPRYNPKSVTRFLAMFAFALTCLLLIFKRKKLGKPDYIVHSSMSIFPFPVALFLKNWFRSKRLIFEVRDLWPLTPIHLMGYSPKHPFIRFIGAFERMAYKRADRVITVLEESSAYISSISGDGSKIRWVPNGVSDEALDPVEKSDITRTELGLPNDKLVVCYTGTIGFANALEPLFNLIQTRPDQLSAFHFLIVGDGYLKDQFVEQTKSTGLVTFIPKVAKETIPAYLQCADICYISWHFSKLYEHGVSANKYFDYLGAGKPVLSAQTGIVDPVIKSGAGLVSENTSEAILNTLQQFASMTEQERLEMGKNGKDYVQANHTFSVLSETFFQAIVDE